MSDACQRCGSERQYGPQRFVVQLRDFSESTAHVSDHTICAECFDGLLASLRGVGNE